jgi:hypothetical protein
MKRAEAKESPWVHNCDEMEVMRLNGETKAMMDHVKVKWKNRCYDTSVDTPWKIDHSLAWRDDYVWYTSLLHLAIKIICLVFPMLFLSILPCIISYVFARSKPTPCEKIDRDCCYWFWYTVAFILFLPNLVLLFVSLAWDYLAYYNFGFVFTFFTCRWEECWKSHRALDPYRDGPSLIWHGADIFSCVIGQTMRHGLLGTAWNLALMWLLMPWMKYYWNVNPWVMDLEERYVQQISTTMKDMALLHNDEDLYPEGNELYVEHGICDTARRIISRAKQFAFVRKDEDLWNFAPHYPYPPEDRRWCVGMQAGGSASTPAKFTLLVHTTHANSDHGGCTEQFVLSNCVHSPVYRVMLWYSNPFHFFTGFVEASISRGGDSQSNKELGGEHPMWLVSAKSPFLSERGSLTGVGMIDQFFDDWLPIFVHQARRLGTMDYYWNVKKKSNGEAYTFDEANEIGKRWADAQYQEVIGQDGLSAPDSRIGRDKYVTKDGKKIDKVSVQFAQRDTGNFLFSAYTSLHRTIIKDDHEDEEEERQQYAASQRAAAESIKASSPRSPGRSLQRTTTNNVSSSAVALPSDEFATTCIEAEQAAQAAKKAAKDAGADSDDADEAGKEAKKAARESSADGTQL